MTDKAEKPSIPKPEPDADSRPWWQALRERRVLVQHCRACGMNQLYFRVICHGCWSRDIEAVQASGKGTVYSFTVVHSVGEPALQAELPYALAIVELAEGPRVMTRIEGDPDRVRIGEPVEATFRDIAPDSTLLYFRREGEAPVAWST
jgi:uncharacterized OB-fold protein